jgi:hypothetical protein
MSTNAIIAVKHGNNFKSIYCHFDGYPSYTSKMLYENYDSPKANHLVALGNVSVLEKNILPKTDTHSRNQPEDDVTIFYDRDCGEKDQEFKCYTTETDFLNRKFIEHFYVMDNSTWSYYSKNTKQWIPLSEVLDNLENFE